MPAIRYRWRPNSNAPAWRERSCSFIRIIGSTSYSVSLSQRPAVLADGLAFAVGTRSWANQGMVEITAGREVRGVEWRFYQKIRSALRTFGTYRCMAAGNSYGAFCQGELIGSGLVLFPHLVLRGGSTLEVVPRTPAHLGVIFESNADCLMGCVADARYAA